MSVSVPGTTAYSFKTDAVGTDQLYYIKLDSGAAGVSAPTTDANPFPVKAQAYPSGGATPYRYTAAASANQDSQVVKASAGQLYALQATNVAASTRFLKFYNSASAPTSAGTPALVLAIPSGQSVAVPVAACGVAFTAGVAFRITTGSADNDATAATAGDVFLNLGFN